MYLYVHQYNGVMVHNQLSHTQRHCENSGGEVQLHVVHGASYRRCFRMSTTAVLVCSEHEDDFVTSVCQTKSQVHLCCSSGNFKVRLQGQRCWVLLADTASPTVNAALIYRHRDVMRVASK